MLSVVLAAVPLPPFAPVIEPLPDLLLVLLPEVLVLIALLALLELLELLPELLPDELLVSEPVVVPEDPEPVVTCGASWVGVTSFAEPLKLHADDDFPWLT